MSQGLTLDQIQQVHHIAQLALLSTCARAFAAAEFDSNPEVQCLHVIARRPVDGESSPVVELEYVGTHGVPLAGMTL